MVYARVCETEVVGLMARSDRWPAFPSSIFPSSMILATASRKSPGQMCKTSYALSMASTPRNPQNGRCRRRTHQEAFRGQLTAFRNLYAFLSQIIPYQDGELERIYAFVRNLISKLPPPGGGRSKVRSHAATAGSQWT